MNPEDNKDTGLKLDNNTAANINSVLDNGDIKSQMGANIHAYNTPILQEIREVNTGPTVVVQKVKNKATPLFLIIILLLFGACYYMYNKANETINYYRNEYSPINTTEEVKLKTDSFLVKSLYSTIVTNIKEDVANPEFNDSLKLYLAYRNLSHDKFYNSNCNMFNNSSMQFITCNEKEDNFSPKAFKVEDMMLSINKMFGETSDLKLNNIQLGTSCLGGYQYIEGRGEFVQGNCSTKGTIIYEVEKKLEDATSTGNKIVLVERVKYSNPTGGSIPDELKSGIYHHVFKMDKNYNYIYLERKLVEERG